MTKSEIIELQKHVGTEPDGFWGPKSTAAVKRHLSSLMPVLSNPWPTQDQASLTAFYGAPGDERRMVSACVRGIGLEYDGQPVSSVYCHSKVAESLVRILTRISEGKHAWVLKQYAGVYNNRKMRGGSLPSLHARGAAIDLAPATNRNRSHWPMASNMPIQVMEIFSREGWLSAGSFWSHDSMHFQATR